MSVSVCEMDGDKRLAEYLAKLSHTHNDPDSYIICRQKGFVNPSDVKYVRVQLSQVKKKLSQHVIVVVEWVNAPNIRGLKTKLVMDCRRVNWGPIETSKLLDRINKGWTISQKDCDATQSSKTWHDERDRDIKSVGYQIHDSWDLNVAPYDFESEISMDALERCLKMRIRVWAEAHNLMQNRDKIKNYHSSYDPDKTDLMQAFYVANDGALALDAISFQFCSRVMGTMDTQRFNDAAEIVAHWIRFETQLADARLRQIERLKQQVERLGNILHALKSSMIEPMFQMETATTGDLPEKWRDYAKAQYPNEETDAWFGIPFEWALSLLKNKMSRPLMSKGLVFMPVRLLRESILESYRQFLNKEMAYARQHTTRLGNAWKNERTRGFATMIAKSIKKLVMGPADDSWTKVGKPSSASEYKRFMTELAPPCMQQMFQKQHLKNPERVVYINFTSKFKIPPQIVLATWAPKFRQYWARNGRNADAEMKQLDGEFKYAYDKFGKGHKRFITCDQMAQKGLCPFMAREASCITAEARDKCSKCQQLPVQTASVLVPVRRIRVEPSVKIEIEPANGKDEKKR